MARRVLARATRPEAKMKRWVRQARSAAATLAAGLCVLAWAALATAVDEDAARTVVEGRMSAVGACVASAGADTHGGVTLTLTLAAAGAVRQADVTQRGPRVSSEVARCMATALRTASFEGGTRDTVIVVRFVVAEGGTSGERVRLRDVSVAHPGGGYGS